MKETGISETEHEKSLSIHDLKKECFVYAREYFHHAVITVRKIKNYGDKYYHHYLEDIKIEPCSGITRPAGKTGK